MKPAKTPLQQLTGDERATLAHFVGSEEHKTLVKLIESERIELAKDHVNQIDMSQVRYLSGKSDGLKGLLLTLRQNKKDKG